MINPNLQPFVDLWDRAWSALPPDADITERRRCFEQISETLKGPLPDDVDDSQVHWVDATPQPVRVRVFRHRSDAPQPCLVFMHGGSWMMGSPETSADLTARIASQNRQTVVSVAYDKIPEYPFPVAIQQCLASVAWVFDNAVRLGIDPDQISVGGESAGGNLAAAVALHLRGSQSRLRAQLLIYPPFDFDFSRPSCVTHAQGPIITAASLPLIANLYCAAPSDRRSPLAAPLLAEDHRGLPPTYLALAECDPLHDSGIAYADALRSAGVQVTLDQGKGLIHGYLRAQSFCPACATSFARMTGWLAAQQEHCR